MTWALVVWAMDGLSTSPWLVKALAVAGGAALGGLGLGAGTQLAAKTLAAQKVPPWPLGGVRLGGAVAGGWLVALWAFGGGGDGLGGSGGWGLGGSGKGTETIVGKATEAEPREKDKKEEKEEKEPAPEPGTLRVEVLGDATIQKIAERTKSTLNLDRRYRVREGAERKLLTLNELKKKVEAAPKDGPVKVLEIKLYKDSPAWGNASYVKPLREWGEGWLGEENVSKNELDAKRNAPLE